MVLVCGKCVCEWGPSRSSVLISLCPANGLDGATHCQFAHVASLASLNLRARRLSARRFDPRLSPSTPRHVVRATRRLDLGPQLMVARAGSGPANFVPRRPSPTPAGIGKPLVRATSAPSAP